ncbi:lmo0937 family membrane protein [Mucilaginibacter sp. Bleaf8]|uniref:lmo0937 family membrane protein n=1 Tax=Mucilaginibacter sp. Bleaf8 TaxID=2834430 RepID=UPI001BCF81F4|nr:lmo0937 family membrane protein [Mucilaginibacter sp. Bleaf8]MBS7563497.1 lmo0937 family membrane protein [Mucilaginibacter sp. Bleaf8]
MRGLLYLVAVVLVILWVVGFLFHGLGSFGDGGIIHVLLVIAIIAILLGVIRRA